MAKVLVIDDDDQVVSVIARWLSETGYEVECACEGERGLRVLENEHLARSSDTPASLNRVRNVCLGRVTPHIETLPHHVY